MTELWGTVADPRGVALCVLLQAADKYFERRGERYHWSYADTASLKLLFVKAIDKILDVDGILSGKELSEKKREGVVQELATVLRELQGRYRELTLGKQPYGDLCATICGDGTCLYRFANRDLTRDPVLQDSFAELVRTYGGDDIGTGVLENAKDVASRVVSSYADEESLERSALCFLLHMSQMMWPREPHLRRSFMEGLLGE
jgi:hypothetical protein